MLCCGDEGNDKIVAYTRTQWSKSDHESVGAIKDEAKYQPHWEAYMLLVAVETWISDLRDPQILVLRGDALGVLQDVIAGRAKNPGLNLIVAEIQLRLAATPHDVSAVHWWSAFNETCDVLSRSSQDVPDELKSVREVNAQRGCWTFLRPTVCKTLYGK